MRHRAGLSQLNGASKADLMDHRKMEERLAAASVNRVLYGKGAYHALTYGWLMSGWRGRSPARACADLIREELAEPLNIRRPAPGPAARRGADEGRADHHPAGHAAKNSVLGAIVPKLAALQWSGGLGALYFPEMVSVVQGDIPFLDGEIPAANGIATATRLWPRCTRRWRAEAGVDGTQFLSTGADGRPDR